jgi:hypothetical protein
MKKVTQTIVMITDAEKEIAETFMMPIISLYSVNWVTSEDYEEIKEEMVQRRKEDFEFYSEMVG